MMPDRLVTGPAGLSDSRASEDDPHPVYLFSDSAQYYLREARRITAPDYKATEDDGEITLPAKVCLS